jgi:hypothetical protein
MTLTALTALARPRSRLLAQYLMTCPSCDKPAAAHVDTDAMELVRFVCPDSCALDAAVVLKRLERADSA